MRIMVFASVVPLTVILTACGSDDSEAAVEENSTDVIEDSAEPAAAEVTGDYVFGLKKEQMIEVIEKSYATDNASATWDGDTMILTMDGDATADASVAIDCRVVTGMLNEEDFLIIEYPNGRVDC